MYEFLKNALSRVWKNLWDINLTRRSSLVGVKTGFRDSWGTIMYMEVVGKGVWKVYCRVVGGAVEYNTDERDELV